MGHLMNRSFQLSTEVYAAMLARGFTGEVRSYSRFRMRTPDWLAAGGSVMVAATAVVAGRLLS
jgi:energy-coupling factor transporter transmembrane protein EcfT